MTEKRLYIAVLILLAAGCVGGQPARTTEYYMLEYAPPTLGDMVYCDDALKVERFSVAQLFNNNTIAYRTGSFSLSTFSYSRWRANPGDMVTDYLVRDFRSSGLFRAVFSYRDIAKTRFVLEGTVTDFFEVQQQGDRKALLSLNVTLLDLNRMETSSKVVFQRSYSHEATYEEKGPRGLARGLSESTRQLSKQIMSDVYRTVEVLNKVQSR